MSKPIIKYRQDDKYHLTADYHIKINIKPEKNINEGFINLDEQGNLTILEGYEWGPVAGPSEFVRPFLVRGVLVELAIQNLIDSLQYEDEINKTYKELLIEDGISKSTAHILYLCFKVVGIPIQCLRKLAKFIEDLNRSFFR